MFKLSSNDDYSAVEQHNMRCITCHQISPFANSVDSRAKACTKDSTYPSSTLCKNEAAYIYHLGSPRPPLLSRHAEPNISAKTMDKPNSNALPKGLSPRDDPLEWCHRRGDLKPCYCGCRCQICGMLYEYCKCGADDQPTASQSSSGSSARAETGGSGRRASRR